MLHGAGIFTYIDHKNHLHVGKYSIHGASGISIWENHGPRIEDIRWPGLLTTIWILQAEWEIHWQQWHGSDNEVELPNINILGKIMSHIINGLKNRPKIYGRYLQSIGSWNDHWYQPWINNPRPFIFGVNLKCSITSTRMNCRVFIHWSLGFGATYFQTHLEIYWFAAGGIFTIPIYTPAVKSVPWTSQKAARDCPRNFWIGGSLAGKKLSWDTLWLFNIAIENHHF